MTPGSTAPLESFTDPVNELCAAAMAGNAIAVHEHATNALRRLAMPLSLDDLLSTTTGIAQAIAGARVHAVRDDPSEGAVPDAVFARAARVAEPRRRPNQLSAQVLSRVVTKGNSSSDGLRPPDTYRFQVNPMTHDHLRYRRGAGPVASRAPRGHLEKTARHPWASGDPGQGVLGPSGVAGSPAIESAGPCV